MLEGEYTKTPVNTNKTNESDSVQSYTETSPLKNSTQTPVVANEFMNSASSSGIPPPPKDSIQELDDKMDNTDLQPQQLEEEKEEEKDEGKQKQIDKLRQTYIDIAKRKLGRQKNIYSPIIDVEKIHIPMNQIDKNITKRITKILKDRLELKCNRHGLIKEDSIMVISVSSPSVKAKTAEFHVTYQALTCNPVEGMIVEATIVNITKAGIRAELPNYNVSPMVIFIARDHNNANNYFNSLKENDVINAKVIGVRYELYDTFVSVIGELYRTI